MRRWLVLGVVLLVTGCDEQGESVALGNLERERVAHTAPAQEVIIALPVSQGEAVTQGDLLVQFDSRIQAAQVAAAQAEVLRAEAQLDKLRSGARVEEVAAAQAEVTGARAAVVDARQSYFRTKDLVDREMQSRAALDHVIARRDSAEASLQSAQERLRQLTNGTREEDLRIAEAELDAAQAKLEGEQKLLEDLSVRATRTGILDNLPWNLGERVTQGSPVAIVLAGDAPFARVYVPETHRAAIKVGDSLLVEVDGVANSILGAVTWISSEPSFTPYYALTQNERSRLMYVAEVQLPANYAHLPSGLPVEVKMPEGAIINE
ncbi:HlyD family secretion protein [Umboniibacter marinipuniceus]|uniref:HlyD family secretion protein n=1 Tax=Umboniibacter marinipuniceus TaxID=569599 RepID=A0A3M0AJ19_9GAMM|nr:HlyD family efflux transporter periplasmic adaptor subunit [Umboniibacter marinipuniceus]RMA82555.1 HlyD family secretion protein [Umboniibacter marinipuniceus]